MVIKAKNTITLVRTDDGLPAHVHTAYSWSADGMDRLTTVYPGENYVLKSKKAYTATGTGANNQYPAEINNILFNPDVLGKNATIQYKVTISNYVSGTYLRLKMYDAVGILSSFSEWNGIAGNGTKLIQWKGTLPPLKDGGRPEIDFNTDLGANIKIEELYIRSGTEYQIYTPSPLEDPSNAYPHYMGTYSDNSPTASTNPADYHWQADPTWLEYSKVGGDQYESDQSEIYEVIGGKADSEEFQVLKREADALMESYNSFVSEGGKYEQDLENIENRAIGLIEQLNDQIAQFEFITTYIRMGQEGLEIGAQDSTMKMLLTKDSLSFMDGGKVVAYFTQQSFYINRGAIVESLQLGNFKFSTVNDDLLVLQYVGG